MLKSLALQWILNSRGKKTVQRSFWSVQQVQENNAFFELLHDSSVLMLDLAALWFSVPLSSLYRGSLEVVTPL